MKKNRHVIPDLQEYRNRTFEFYSEIDEMTFDILNYGVNPDTLTLMFCGCLDALEFLPAGSMNAVNGYCGMTMIERGMTLEEMKAFEALIDEILEDMVDVSCCK